MNILFVGHQAYYGLGRQGGAETYAHSLMRFFVSLGWEASAVVFGPNPTEFNIDGVTVYRRRSSSHFLDLALRADVIVTQLGGTAAGMKAAKAVDVPLVQIVHNTSRYTVGFLGAGVDLAIYNALWVRDFHEQARHSRLIQLVKRPGQAIVKARLQKAWPYVVVRPPTEGEYIGGAKPGKKITLVNLTPNKGPEILYALAEAHPELQFMGVIGGYEQNQQDIRRYENVSIHPHTQIIDDFYSETSVLIVPSRYESYGRVAVEGMQRGIPVIASDTPGLRECLGSSGYLLERTPEAFSAALFDVLANYDAASMKSELRYKELQALTLVDLENLATAIKGLI